MRVRTLLILLLALAACIPAVPAADPPELINFQGVLRDAADNPLDGPQEMVFHLYDAPGDASCVGGTLLLSDRHTGYNPVDVTGGLFSVQIGSGSILPGAANSLAELFRDYGEVYLEVQIGKEHLCPRTRVVAAGYALNAAKLAGQDPSYYLDSSATPQTKIGSLTLDPGTGSTYGITAYGESGGGYFVDSNSSGYCYAGAGNYGIQGYGEIGGGYFDDTNSTGLAHVAYGDLGITAYGETAGGRFRDSTGTGMAELGKDNLGIDAEGSLAGGRFQNVGGTSWAYIGYDPLLGEYGVYAKGETAAGYFKDTSGSGTVRLGYGDVGITASGTDKAGYFEHGTGSDCYVELAPGTTGIKGSSWDAGGFFEATYPSTSTAAVYTAYAVGQDFYSIRGWATDGGVWVDDDDDGTYGVVAAGSSSTSGNGAKNFIQNHPEMEDQVIVYTSLEGDEAGTYTRGSGRLVDGMAQVELGETFRWVTNPDIGLTAYLTVRGEPVPMAVESLSTEELVVRGPAGSNAMFDFIVFGLRIGFEEAGVVQEKKAESMIPSMASHRERYEREPELRRFNPLERYKQMAVATGQEGDVDLSRATALRDAITEYSRETHGPVWELKGHGPAPPKGRSRPTTQPQQTVSNEVDPTTVIEQAPATENNREAAAMLVETVPDRTTRQTQQTVMMPVSGPVEAGDVLAFDSENQGKLRKAAFIGDPAVVGIAVAPAEREGESLLAPVAMTGLVRCKVDAGYGAVRIGDLLTTSPTPGHAMHAMAAEPGTILGKAAATLETGTGTIEILVMPR